MRALLCSIALLAASCAHTKDALLISGATIQTAGEQFVAVAELMNDQLDNKKITTEKYMQWAEFASKFQAVYPAAVHIWKMARLANDKVMQDKAAELIVAMIPELVKFASEVGIVVDEVKR